MERNITLDYFKLGLILFIILIHLNPIFINNDFLSYIFNGYARIGVPCFFLISGYFFYPKIKDWGRTSQYIKHLLLLALVWTFIYLPVNSSSPQEFMKFFFNLFMGIHHLWYLMALIIAILMYFLLKKIVKDNTCLLVIGVSLFIVGYIIQYLIKVQNYSPMAIHKCRNALFFALPFLILGGTIYTQRLRLMKLDDKILIGVIVFSLFPYFFEIYSTYNLLFVTSYLYRMDLYLSTLLLCPSLFILVLKYSKYKKSDGYLGLLSESVYLVHPLTIDIVMRSLFLNEAWAYDNKLYLIPLILLFSFLLSVGVIELNKRFKIFL